jgi:hypothetical protein
MDRSLTVWNGRFPTFWVYAVSEAMRNKRTYLTHLSIVTSLRHLLAISRVLNVALKLYAYNKTQNTMTISYFSSKVQI